MFIFLKKQEIRKITPSCRSVICLINIMVLGGIFGPKRSKRIFLFLDQKSEKTDFCAPEHFCRPKSQKVKKSDQKLKNDRSKLERIYIYVSWEVLFAQNALLRFFPFWSEKSEKVRKNRKFRAKRKIPHISAFSRKWAQNTYKRHWF